MPLSEGIPIVCHPDPTDAVNIGKGVARYEDAPYYLALVPFYAYTPKIHEYIL